MAYGREGFEGRGVAGGEEAPDLVDESPIDHGLCAPADNAIVLFFGNVEVQVEEVPVRVVVGREVVGLFDGSFALGEFLPRHSVVFKGPHDAVVVVFVEVPRGLRVVLFEVGAEGGDALPGVALLDVFSQVARGFLGFDHALDQGSEVETAPSDEQGHRARGKEPSR